MVKQDKFLFFDYDTHRVSMLDTNGIIRNPNRYDPDRGHLYINIENTQLFFKIVPESVIKAADIMEAQVSFKYKVYDDDIEYNETEDNPNYGWKLISGGVAKCKSISDIIKMLIIEDMVVSISNDIVNNDYGRVSYTEIEHALCKMVNGKTEYMAAKTIFNHLLTGIDNLDFRVGITGNCAETASLIYAIDERFNYHYDDPYHGFYSIYRSNMYVFVTKDDIEQFKHVDLTFRASFCDEGYDEGDTYIWYDIGMQHEFALTTAADIIGFSYYASLVSIFASYMTHGLNYQHACILKDVHYHDHIGTGYRDTMTFTEFFETFVQRPEFLITPL